MHQIEFDFVRIDALLGATRTPEYMAKFPTALIPAMDDNNFYLAEGSAICIYLCEKYGWGSFYPTGTDADCIRQRARINEYLSHHHYSSRMLSVKFFRPFMLDTFSKKLWTREKAKEHEPSIFKIAKSFETTFLSQGKFISGTDHPTVADMIAYPEFAQMEQFGLVTFDEVTFPLLSKWLKSMAALPGHDDVHQTLHKVAKMGGLKA